MDMFDFAGMLFGQSRTAPDAKTVTATGAVASDGGEVGITLDADVTPAEDTGVEGDADQTIIDLPTSPDVDEGDELIVTLVGDGPLKTPVVTANPGSGDRMRALANSAKTVADAAQAVAEAVNQHFFADTNGIHVTESTQDEWNESHTGANVLINSIGQLFRDGLNNLLTLTTEDGARALTIWDGLGNTASNVLATFGATETHIGLGDGISSVFLANDKFRMRGVTQERTPTSGSGTLNETYGNILAETVWDGPTQDESWDPSTGHSYVSRAAIDTYALVPGNEASLKLTAKAMDWQGESPETRISPGGYGPDDFDPYVNASQTYEANIEIHSETANLTNSSYVYTTASRVGYYTDMVTYAMTNGDNEWSTPAGTVLWSASSGWAMAANVTATLDYPVTSCPSGIVLHWQAYASGAVQNYAHVYTFVPKQHVVANAGGGVTCQLAHSAFSQVGTKYVYVNDGSIVGNAANTQSGTANGITYNNGYWVLTQVISA